LVDGPLSIEVMADRWQDLRLLPPPGSGEAEEDGVMVMLLMRFERWSKDQPES
jgi:hypothetical protein